MNIRRGTFLLAALAATLALRLSDLALAAGEASNNSFPQIGKNGWVIPAAFVEGDGTLPGYSGCGDQTAPYSNPDYEQRVYELVNEVREDHGLPPLKRATDLDEAARYHATDLAQDAYFQHDSYDRDGGDLVWVCEWSTRVNTYYDWTSLAENAAGGQSTPQEVMNTWMNSPGHRNNILRTSVWEIGIGYHAGGSYWHYWVQNFGRRSDVYPLIINREAPTTNSRAVSLYIYGDWDEIRLRNDQSAWTEWIPFQSEMTWTLNRGAGNHTVWAEMRDGGDTGSSNDTINLLVSGSAAPHIYDLLLEDSQTP